MTRFTKSDEPIRAMENETNSLKHPPSTSTTISESSINAANYLVRFEKREILDLFKKLPSLDQVWGGAAQKFIMDAYKKLDESKGDA